MTKSAIITGITGQDGSYLAELLLAKGYVVHGVVRHSSSVSTSRIAHLAGSISEGSLVIHQADLSDVTTLRRILMRERPDEFYHLAGQSHVGLSFDIPESTCDFTAMGTLRILEVLRDLEHPVRFLNIASSEIFGDQPSFPQNEITPLCPTSPYGVAKAFALNITKVYRESFDLFGCNAICYNHESPRRGEGFVTRKISRAAAAISLGIQDKLILGNLDTRRDWGFAPEYVEAMWLMLQRASADDFVLATGVSSQLKLFLQYCFEAVDLDWEKYVETDPAFIRPNDPAHLVGDASKAKKMLGWQAKTSLSELAQIMVASELGELKNGNSNE